MQVRPFNAKDMPTLHKWCYKRGVDLKTEPAHIGFIVPGVAIGFLIETNAEVGILDSLITNPYVSAKSRDSAMYSIFEYGIKLAEAKGIKSLIGFTIDDNTLKRAETFGFVAFPHKLLIRSNPWHS